MKANLNDLNNQLIAESTAKFDEIIFDMDTKMGNVIKAQEADYLKGYSIYVN